MKILVLVKETPDTETKIKLTADAKAIDPAGVKYIINPYDEYAIEEALKIKGDSANEVVIVSVGSPASKERLIKGLAMGADRGLLVDNTGLEQSDSLQIAKILAGVIKSESPDLVLTGKQAIDDDNMQVMTMVAELLDWPHVNVINKLQIDGKQAVVERSVEGGQVEVYKVALPAVFGADKALNSPRYASLPGIMKAKKKPFDVKKPADFGVNIGNSQSVIAGYQYPAEKPKGKMFQGEPVEVMVQKVVKLLREEAKVI